MPRNYAIIVAAGKGERFGSRIPKQFHPLDDGKPVLLRTVETFYEAGFDPDSVIVVLSHEMVECWTESCSKHGLPTPAIAEGGDTRFASVNNALSSRRFEYGDKILVHDGARPLVSIDLIKRVIKELDSCPAVVPAVAVTDSLRVVATDGSSKVVDRSLYRAIQTPQGFDALTLRNAYDTPFSKTFTDDATVAEASGCPIRLIDGETTNIKITTPSDLAVARELLAGRK